MATCAPLTVARKNWPPGIPCAMAKTQAAADIPK